MMMNKIPKGYKQTEVGVIPVDWEVKKIGNVCRLINGRGFKPFEWKKEGLPIIRIQNLNGSDEYNYYKGTYDKKIEVAKGQLLFAWSGSRGTSFGPYVWYGPNGLLNYHTWKVVVNETFIESGFFLHSLKKLTKFIEEKAHGASALVHTQKWEMEGFLFSLPPTKAEQAAIAAVLNDTDALIQSLEKLIEKKRLIKQGVMQELFKPKEGWVAKKLGEICNKVVNGGTPSTQIAEYWNGSIPWITGADIVNQKVRNIRRYINDDAVKNSATNITEKGNLLVVTRTGVGKLAIAPFDIAISQDITGINVNNKMADVRFLYNYFDFKSSILQASNQGTSIAGITKKALLSKLIFIPSKLGKQTRIATILSDMDAEITALEAKATKYKQVKQGMMQELLTGKIRLI